jgi:hypothetical protein
MLDAGHSGTSGRWLFDAACQAVLESTALNAARLACSALAAATLACSPVLAQAPADQARRAGPSITLELNKLETAAGGCRAYFVVENRTSEGVKELRLDTFIFDAGGQITRRIGLTFPDIRPDRTKVVPFDLNGAACPEIGRVLVNDVLACTAASGAPVGNCGDLLKVTSRAGTKFEY